MNKYFNLIKALVIYGFVGFINQFVAVNMINKSVNIPLYDIGLESLPHVDPFYCDSLIVIMAIYFVIRWKLDHDKMMMAFKILTYIFVLRFFTFTLTFVPHPNKQYDCQSRINAYSPIRWNVLPYLLENSLYACHDLMFSGHAAHFGIILLYTLLYSNYQLERIVVSIITLIGIILIPACRFHYSSDTIIGFSMSFLFFGFFSWLSTVREIKKYSRLIKTLTFLLFMINFVIVFKHII